MVLISGMVTQKYEQVALIKEAKRRGKVVVVGGPFATSTPDIPKQAGADFLVLDEGEITIPRFIDALERGETSGVFRADGEQADMSQSPPPRFDLLNFDHYMEMCIQFSRGCPYLCEFCDIPVLYGRVPRAKSPEQIIAELDRLIELGSSKNVFIADDNFIGNKKKAKGLLAELITWQQEKGYPTQLYTEATMNLADDDKLMLMMQKANFRAIFIGIESPDTDQLQTIKKKQNCGRPMIDRIQKIYRYGFRIIGGFIIGFDGETPGADRRIVEFAQNAAIPMLMVHMMSALPNTPLTKRLEAQGQLRLENSYRDGHLTASLSNFALTRPLKEVAEEYINCMETLYDPYVFYERLYRHCMLVKPSPNIKRLKVKNKTEYKALLVLLWRHGIKRPSRFRFWSYGIKIARKNPKAIRRFGSLCGQFEHFHNYNHTIREKIYQEYESLGQSRFDVYEPDLAPLPVAITVNKP